MKDQYTADVNDYLKYGLLRAVAAAMGGLGVIWMLTASDERTDGGRVSYLNDHKRYDQIDPWLFHALGQLVRTGSRNVAAVQSAQIVPGATYFAEVLTHLSAQREKYFARALLAVQRQPVVFFDPDNGLEVKSAPKGHRDSSKYLYWDELVAAYRAGHSVICYQHFPRQPRLSVLGAVVTRAKAELGLDLVITVTTAHAAFVALPQRHHVDRIENGAREFSARASPFATLDLW